MGIVDRMSTMIRSNINEVLDRMTDPGKEIELLITDMQAAEKKATQELIEALGEVKLTRKQLEDTEAEARRWHERAEGAVRSGDEELAREALRQRLATVARVDQTRVVLQEQEARCGELRQGLRAFQDRLRIIKARKETLKERARSAHRGEDPLQEGQAFRDMQKIEGRIDAMEAELQMTEELEGRRFATEAKFAKLEPGQEQVEDDLAELKRRMERGE